MAKIPLSEGFSVIPEGEHIFKITDVKYKEAFGKMEVTMVTAKKQKHIEKFSLLDKEGNPNEGAMNAFSYFAKTALNDFSLEEIDHEDLVGCYICCEIVHTEVESNKKPGKMVTFVNLGDKSPADGFDEEIPAAKPKEAPTPAPADTSEEKPKKFDLGSILG